MSTFFEILKAILFGIVEGITEWLPISSTGHMILLEEFVKLDVSEAFWNMFLVVIQLGAILAVVCLFFRKLNPFSLKKTAQQRRDTWSMWFKVAVGSIPAGVIGLAINDLLEEYLNTYYVVAAMLILYGILFIIVENRNKYRTPLVTDFPGLTYKTAFLIGAFQALSLIPGTSRSGATILGAIFLGCSRYIAAEYSFFLAIPAMVVASGYKALNFFLDGNSLTGNEIMILLVGCVTAFLVSILAIKFLMGYIKKRDFKGFGWYRIILGGIVLLFFLIRTLVS